MNPSENCPEPTPGVPPVRRRRRQAFADMPQAQVPVQPDASGEVHGSASPLRRSPQTARVYHAAPPRWPLAARVTLGALIAVILLACGVTITRQYLATQEQKRIAQEEAALKARHPLYYREIIEAAASENNLNPALLCAVILCESSYDPQAESRLGARGLMQLMEPTAEWIAEKLNVENYSFDMMYDTETNVRFGAWYLGYLARRFDGDALNVVCAYHAGQGNVDSWLSNPLYSSDGVTLATIPTDDTAKYAKRVLSAYEVYEKYYYPPVQDADGAAADAAADVSA